MYIKNNFLLQIMLVAYMEWKGFRMNPITCPLGFEIK